MRKRIVAANLVRRMARTPPPDIALPTELRAVADTLNKLRRKVKSRQK